MSAKKRATALVRSRQAACEAYTTKASVRLHFRNGYTEGWNARAALDAATADIEAERAEAARSET